MSLLFRNVTMHVTTFDMSLWPYLGKSAIPHYMKFLLFVARLITSFALELVLVHDCATTMENKWSAVSDNNREVKTVMSKLHCYGAGTAMRLYGLHTVSRLWCMYTTRVPKFYLQRESDLRHRCSSSLKVHFHDPHFSGWYPGNCTAPKQN